jgi:hypothetical protein
MNTQKRHSIQLWILLLSFSFITHSHAQSWQRNLIQNNNHFRDYSVAQSLDDPDKIVLAGTLEDRVTGNTSIHLVGFDVNTANVTFEKTYLNITNSRAFHITAFNTGTDVGYAVSGSLEAGGFRRAALLLVDESGNLLNSATYDLEPGSQHSQGLHVIATPDDPMEGFLMVGYTDEVNPLSDFRGHPKLGFALKVDQSLNVQWGNYFDRPYSGITFDYDGVSHVMITDHGYFITGGKNTLYFTHKMGIMAIMIDFNGNLLWDQSYFRGNAFDVGASAYYDQPNDEIYLLADYSALHHLGVTVFDAATGTINLSKSFTTSSQNLDKYGFSIQPSPSPDKLWIAGHARDQFWTGTSYNRGGPAIIVEYDMISQNFLLKHLETHLSMPIPGFTDVFSPFFYQMPFYFYPEMAATLGTEGGVYVSYQGATASDDLELVVSKLDYWERFLFCDTDTLELNIDPLNLFPTSIVDSINVDPINVSPQPTGFSTMDDPSEIKEMCFLVGQEEVQIPSGSWTVFPNPAQGQIQIEWTQDLSMDEEVKWILISPYGQHLQTTTERNPMFNIESYPSGIYWIMMTVEDRTIGGKKIVIVD